jgi:hypothetical protein
VCSFLRDISQSALVFSEAPYEIVYYQEPHSGKDLAFDLSFILPWTLKRRWGGWRQTVTKDYAERARTPRNVELPSDSVFLFRLPESINRYYSRMMKDLDLLGRELTPDFALPTPGETFDSGFDFKEWRQCSNIAVAQATAACGWNGRNSFSKEITEFYFIERFLKFELFKLELRTSLLTQLNDLLQIVGRRLGFSVRIIASGLPDKSQIDESTQQLASGTASFADVTRPYIRY